MSVAADSSPDGNFTFACAVVRFGGCASPAEVVTSAAAGALQPREREYAALSLPKLDRLAGRLAARAAVEALQREEGDEFSFEVRPHRSGAASVFTKVERLGPPPMLSISHDGGVAIAIAVTRP